MPRTANPLHLWNATLQMTFLLIETQSVITMRLLGMAGLWNVTRSENTRMVDEKPPAMMQSAMNAVSATMNGARPDQIVTSAIRPLRAKTRSNTNRLAKRGPKFN
ncbi:antifreeze protein [Puniceibacterium confluentis]|uniref:antifreeze protein n=1 Tax=Puniceibacterium confluentis TaxID=1958944 RepID=UPI0016466E6E|nr:antifreeze protein [Puniceibacterium confluentis]